MTDESNPVECGCVLVPVPDRPVCGQFALYSICYARQRTRHPSKSNQSFPQRQRVHRTGFCDTCFLQRLRHASDAHAGRLYPNAHYPDRARGYARDGFRILRAHHPVQVLQTSGQPVLLKEQCPHRQHQLQVGESAHAYQSGVR
ncbi:hypothetical protein D3C72_1155390 [compost metagenome]